MRGGGNFSDRGRGRFSRNYQVRTDGAQRTFSKSVKCYTCGENGHLSWDYLTNIKGDARQEVPPTQLTNPKSKPGTLRDDRARSVPKNKVLFAYGNKRKSNKNSEECQRIKGKWKVKLVDDSQPSTSKGERSGRYNLHFRTDEDQRKIIFIIKCTSRK